MEAIEDAENIIHPLLEKNDIDEEVKKQAINVKAQLDHSKIYYKWLAQLSEALESGEILTISQFQMNNIIMINKKKPSDNDLTFAWLFVISYRLQVCL